MTQATPILDRVIACISDLSGKPTSEIQPEHKFDDDLGFDSLDSVELLMYAEDEFEVAIPEPEAEKVNTVGEFAALIERLQSPQEADA